MPTRDGELVWQPSAIRRVLTNRRYIGQIEINREHKDADALPSSESYQIARAHYEPLVPVELFELAQALRREKAAASPNRRGRPRSYGKNQCNRVYPLQGIMICGVCRHAMAPYYICHRAGHSGGKKRKSDSYIHYYCCAQQIKGWKRCDHRNHIIARKPEAWILRKVQELVDSDDMIERAMEWALRNCTADLQPLQDTLATTRAALQDNQSQIDQIITTISSGQAQGALLGFLNERAGQLKVDRERLRVEQQRLSLALKPLDEYYDPAVFRSILSHFAALAQEAEPEELHRLLRLAVKRIEWMPDGAHAVKFYHLPKSRWAGPKTGPQWFATNVRNGSP